MDIAGDDAGVWMTYDQLAAARDIQRDGARRLAQRHRWRRHAGNDGLARVLVPNEWASASRDIARDVTRDKEDAATKQSRAVTPDVAEVVTALQGAVDTLRQRAEQAEEDASEAHKRADVAVALADRTQTQLADATTDVGKLRDRLEAAQAYLRAAQATAEELRQAEAARKARGRLRRAWDGWWGR